MACAPGIPRDFDFYDSLDHIPADWLPLRAEPEADTDSPTQGTDWFLGKLVEAAVQQVGWVPRDVYKFMAEPTTFGMFCMLEIYRC